MRCTLTCEARSTCSRVCGIGPSLRGGGLGHLVVRDELRPAVVRRHLGQRRGQGGLAVVDVADGPDVDVRLLSLELLLGHGSCSSVAMIGSRRMGEALWAASLNPIEPAILNAISFESTSW